MDQVINSVLSNLEAAAVFRSSEVVVSSLLGRPSLFRMQVLMKFKNKLKKVTPSYTDEEELILNKGGWAALALIMSKATTGSVTRYMPGDRHYNDYIYVNDSYPKLQVEVVRRATGNEDVVCYRRFLDVHK